MRDWFIKNILWPLFIRALRAAYNLFMIEAPVRYEVRDIPDDPNTFEFLVSMPYPNPAKPVMDWRGVFIGDSSSAKQMAIHGNLGWYIYVLISATDAEKKKQGA